MVYKLEAGKPQVVSDEVEAGTDITVDTLESAPHFGVEWVLGHLANGGADLDDSNKFNSAI